MLLCVFHPKFPLSSSLSKINLSFFLLPISTLPTDLLPSPPPLPPTPSAPPLCPLEPLEVSR